ncbi:MAG: DUF262 domain-containing HNH endonuclease family protein [Pseudanabaena sp. Salubria-1]|nr:DUF262 domain-containing HNH endonuclease family protein [Pseudanabaena sp. Salubria-1]
MKASETNFQNLTDRKVQYLVPLFQRPYSWDKKEWNDLLSDITELCIDDNSRNHFIGSIVVTDLPSKPKKLACYYLLIDGQQRLTTIFVLLILMRDIAATASGFSVSSEQIEEDNLVNKFAENLEHFKILPTQQDREVFIALVTSEPSCLQRVHPLITCYNFFKKGIKKLNLDKLHEVICKKLSIVEIVLESDDNPYVVFESLNNRGRLLTEVDLIRNYFLMKIDKDRQEDIYKEYWLPMQKSLGDETLNDFMFHYLSSGGEIVGQKEIYLTLKRRVDRYEDAFEALKRIKKFSHLYEKIINPQKEVNSIIRSKLVRINRLDYTSVYSFLLNCYHEYENNTLSVNDFASILEILENFIVRRIICKIQIKGLNKEFPLLYQNAIARSSSLLDGVKAILEANEYPRDTKFRESVIRAAFTYSNDKLKLILETIEQHILKSEPLSPTKVDWIMPKKPTSDWISELGENWQQYHDLYVNTLGNLTLVPLNYDLSNKSFLDKQIYFSNSDLALNRYFQSIDKWDHTYIEKRAEYLAEIALQIWSYFGISNQTSGYEIQTSEHEVTGTRPTNLEILGDVFPVKAWKEVYLTVLDWISEYEPSLFVELSKQYPNLISDYYHEGILKVHVLKNGYYVGTCLSAKSIYQFCSQAFQYIGLSDEDWKVERQTKP